MIVDVPRMSRGMRDERPVWATTTRPVYILSDQDDVNGNLSENSLWERMDISGHEETDKAKQTLKVSPCLYFLSPPAERTVKTFVMKRWVKQTFYLLWCD